MSDYQSMACLQCVRKHLANAISYAKEVLAGHGAGGDPDHRPDLLGELGNAEHHLESDPDQRNLLDRALSLRRRFEDSGYVPYPGMITELRRLWAEVSPDIPDPAMPIREVPRPLPVRTKGRYTLPANLESRAPVDILLLPGNSDSELAGIKAMIANNLTGVGKVYEGVLPDTATQYILVWPPHTGIIREMDAGLDYPVYTYRPDGTVDWSCKPQVVQTDTWRKHGDMDKSMSDHALNYEAAMALLVDMSTKARSICCGTKGRLRMGAYFVRWIPDNWKLLSSSLTPQMRWPD